MKKMKETGHMFLIGTAVLLCISQCGYSVVDSDRGAEEQDETVCSPGSTEPCKCDDGTEEVRKCDKKGDGWNECRCNSGPAATDIDTDSDSDSDSDSDTDTDADSDKEADPDAETESDFSSDNVPQIAKKVTGGPNSSLPPIDDYGDKGPFKTVQINNTGPSRNYTMFLPDPDGELGKEGFLHPIATWGNGITTVPRHYRGLLSTIASHGVVIIASNSRTVTAARMTDGLEWLIDQNDAGGEFEGKLNPEKAISIGYSLGGGAAVDAGRHDAVVCTVSFHGLEGASNRLNAPLLLFTSTGDNFVSARTYVTPTFEKSRVQTAYATLQGGSHLYPMGDAGEERAPAVAWIRLWAYDDMDAKKYFYGADCLLSKSPWADYRRKNWPANK